MIARLIFMVSLVFLALAAHLRNDRRKGSHRQTKHGNRYRSEGGKRILASAGGGSSGKKTSRADKGRKLSGFASAKNGKKEKKRSALADLYDEDDEPEVKSKEDKQRERYESQQIRALEKAERSRLNSALMEAGGIKTRSDLREEYAGIPNTFKRKDGLAGDEMAEYLSSYYPEFGIEDERDLIDFLAA